MCRTGDKADPVHLFPAYYAQSAQLAAPGRIVARSVRIAVMAWEKYGNQSKQGITRLEYDVLPHQGEQIMRVIASLLLAGSILANTSSMIAQSRPQPAVVQSLSSGIYRPATVIFERQRARVQFNRGGKIVLDLDSPVSAESEEIVGVDQNHNYWAVYVDNQAPEGIENIKATCDSAFWLTWVNRLTWVNNTSSKHAPAF